jgi:hypothetical protein
MSPVQELTSLNFDIFCLGSLDLHLVFELGKTHSVLGLPVY